MILLTVPIKSEGLILLTVYIFIPVNGPQLIALLRAYKAVKTALPNDGFVPPYKTPVRRLSFNCV